MTQIQDRKIRNESPNPREFIWVVAIFVVVIAMAVVFSVVAQQERHAAMQANELVVGPCAGKADGYELDQCPTANGKQRYCRNERVLTRACSPA